MSGWVRSKDDRWLAGICGGLAVYLNLDATLVRVLTIILACVTGFVLVIVYIVLIFVLPLGTPQPRP